MRIDRAKFFLLTTTIAAGGCVVVDSTGDGGSGASTSASTTGSTSATATTSSAGGGDTGGGGVGGSNMSGGDVGGSNTGGSATGGSTTTGTGGGEECSDDTGTAADCTQVKAGDCGDVNQTTCTGAAKWFKPYIAETATQCYLGESGVCDDHSIYGCAFDALQIACPDATTKTVCDGIKPQCVAAYKDEAEFYEQCEALLSGITPAGRAKVVACATQDCTYGVFSCVEGLLFTP